MVETYHHIRYARAGSGEEAAYDGSMLAEEGDIVVVTISYRLGAFGFLHDVDRGIVNLGQKDQITALRWVRKNISCFGGNPDKVIRSVTCNPSRIIL